MNLAKPAQSTATDPVRSASPATTGGSLSPQMNRNRRTRLVGYLGFIALLVLGFGKPLYSLMVYASGSDLHSHIILVPLISAYLIRLKRKQLPKDYFSSPGWAVIPLILGVAALAPIWGLVRLTQPFSQNDAFALIALGFVCFLAAGGFLFLGKKWIAAAAFPFAFLLFMIPLPDRAVDWFENASKFASAEAASWFFCFVRDSGFTEWRRV